MALTVKNKIWLGTLFLFFLLLLTGGTGIYYMAQLKKEARNVLQDNYESLSYGHIMQQQLSNYKLHVTGSLEGFEEVLKLQEDNITEPGEKKVTAELRANFNKLKTGDSSWQSLQVINGRLQLLLDLNMTAIKRKSMSAEKTAEDALIIIITICGIVFLIAFTFIVNFPSIVTHPINQLAEAIKEIANKNYKHRVHISNRDEFGNLAAAFNEMAERLQFFESSNLNKLLFEKSRAEAVINSLKDASIGIDKNDVVLFANSRALELLGMPSEEVVGKTVDDVKSTNDLFGFLVDKDTTTPFKIVVDNRENYFIKEVVEVAQGSSSNKVIVLKNITSYKELDVAKSNFIATISHELKTPLASSDFSLKLLEDERISTLLPEQKALVDNLKQDNKRMLKILSELLNMSQVEAGRIKLNIQPVKPGKIIENAIQAVEATARQKSITIRNAATVDLPIIHADADKTTWIITNLLTNAIKYSFDSSTVEVNASLKDKHIVFSITDHGPGIDKKYLPRLFEKYFQVPGTTKKGTGLGLAIAKEFAEAQKGGISVESEAGSGSTFMLTLPFD